MSQFPSRELDEPVTTDRLQASMSELRVEMSQVKVEMSEIRVEVADFRAEMNDRFRQQTVWLVSTLIGAMVANLGVATAIAASAG